MPRGVITRIVTERAAVTVTAVVLMLVRRMLMISHINTHTFAQSHTRTHTQLLQLCLGKDSEEKKL